MSVSEKQQIRMDIAPKKSTNRVTTNDRLYQKVLKPNQKPKYKILIIYTKNVQIQIPGKPMQNNIDVKKRNKKVPKVPKSTKKGTENSKVSIREIAKKDEKVIKNGIKKVQ